MRDPKRTNEYGASLRELYNNFQADMEKLKHRNSVDQQNALLTSLAIMGALSISKEIRNLTDATDDQTAVIQKQVENARDVTERVVDLTKGIADLTAEVSGGFTDMIKAIQKLGEEVLEAGDVGCGTNQEFAEANLKLGRIVDNMMGLDAAITAFNKTIAKKEIKP